MTTDGVVKGITALTGLIILVSFPLAVAAVGQPGVPEPVVHLTHFALVVAGTILLVSLLGAPNAVQLNRDGLVIERKGLGDYQLPFSDISSVHEAPALASGLRGEVRRVAGNGGFFGFTGLFSVKGVGTVRCWATRLNTPTVLIERHDARPVLLGVDEPDKLLAALRLRLRRRGLPTLY